MKRIDLNIGFGDNPYTVQEIIEFLYGIFGNDQLIQYRKELGEWEGKTEATLVVRLATRDSLSVIVSKLSGLSGLLNQECIAVSADAFELLVYRPEQPESSKIKFDKAYFKPFYAEQEA